MKDPNEHILFASEISLYRILGRLEPVASDVTCEKDQTIARPGPEETWPIGRIDERINIDAEISLLATEQINLVNLHQIR